MNDPLQPLGYRTGRHAGEPIWPISGAADESDDDDEAGSTEAPPGTPPAPASVAAPADAVRNSPEYRQKAAEARANARRAGDLERQLTEARTQAANAQAAAEAQDRERQANEIRSILGDDGVAEWETIAELSATDPVAAARGFRGLMDRMVQNQPAPGTAPAGATTPPAPPAGVDPVAQGTRGFPTGRVDASVPMGQPGTDNSWQQIADEAEARFGEAVKRQQGSLQDRSRFTGKDRREAVMDLLVAGYAKAVQAGKITVRAR